MNRTDELRSCPLYRRLAPRKWLEKYIIVQSVILTPLIVAAGAAKAYDKCFAPDVEMDWQVLVSILLETFLFVGTIIFGTFVCVRKARETYARQTKQLAQLDAHQILALQEEISASEMLYGTFYLLREYVYAPRDRLLIRYEDINRWSTTYNVNAFRTAAQISTKDGSYLHIGIWQDRKYEKEYDSFKKLLDSYMQNTAGRQSDA